MRIEQLRADLTEDRRTQIGTAINHFRIMEEKVEKARATQPPGEVDVARFNKVVSNQIDALEKVMTAIKQAGV